MGVKNDKMQAWYVIARFKTHIPLNQSQDTTPTMSALGHALRPDGTLKDASEMSWSYDSDDSVPFPQNSSVGQATGKDVHPFFTGGHTLAMTVTEPRWSGCLTRPS